MLFFYKKELSFKNSYSYVEMTSGGLGLSEGLGQDISQDELDFSDLFLYNQAEDDFPIGCDKGVYAVIILLLLWIYTSCFLNTPLENVCFIIKYCGFVFAVLWELWGTDVPLKALTNEHPSIMFI